MGSIEGTLVKC